MRRGALAAYGAVVAALLVIAAPASGASKNVELLHNLPEVKDATAINFMSYGHGANKRDVMLVTGRFGLKSYSLQDPAHPALLDEITAEELRLPGDPPVNTNAAVGPDLDVLAERGHGHRPGPQAGAALARPARLCGLDVA